MSFEQWNGSAVMAEFAKKAAESGLISSDLSQTGGGDLVGNPSKENPEFVRHKPTEDYDITEETGEQLIDRAHPKPVTVADAQGSGALVENVNEQQRHDLEVATKMPHGTLVGVHASLTRELAKIAEELDSRGKEAAAVRVDKSMKKVGGIVGSIGAIAINPWFLIPALVVGLGVAANYVNFFGYTETLNEDLKDLINVIEEFAEDSEPGQMARDILSDLRPYANRFARIPSRKDAESFAIFVRDLDKFGQMLPQLEADIKMMVVTSGGADWYKFGLDQEARVVDKLNSVKKCFSKLSSVAGAAATVGAQQIKRRRGKGRGERGLPGKGDRNIAAIQKLVGMRPTGRMNGKTQQAIRNAEKRIQKIFDKHLADKGWNVIGLFLRDDGTTMEAGKMKEIMELAESYIL